MSRGRRGPTSSTHLGVHVGADWWVTCHKYPEEGPILVLRTGDTSISVSAHERKVTADHVEFAYALVAAANDYLVELERLSQPADMSEPVDVPEAA